MTTWQELIDARKGGPIVADGAMGTMLMANGLEFGDPPELWNLEHPEIIRRVQRAYLDAGRLNVELLGRGYAWFDTGTHESILEASQFIATIESRQGMKVACPEEIALGKDWIDIDRVERTAQSMIKTGYGQYLRQLVFDARKR